MSNTQIEDLQEQINILKREMRNLIYLTAEMEKEQMEMKIIHAQTLQELQQQYQLKEKRPRRPSSLPPPPSASSPSTKTKRRPTCRETHCSKLSRSYGFCREHNNETLACTVSQCSLKRHKILKYCADHIESEIKSKRFFMNENCKVWGCLNKVVHNSRYNLCRNTSDVIHKKYRNDFQKIIE